MMVRPPGLPVTSSGAALPADDRGAHRAEHAFARRHAIGRRANAPGAIGHAGQPVEVVHLIVEQKPAAASRRPGCRKQFSRVYVRLTAVPSRSTTERCVVWSRFGRDGDVAGERFAGRGPIGIDGGCQLAGKILVEKLFGNLRERGVAQVACPLAIRPLHAFNQAVQRRRGPARLRCEVECLQHVERSGSGGAARGRRGHGQDFVAAIGAHAAACVRRPGTPPDRPW